MWVLFEFQIEIKYAVDVWRPCVKTFPRIHRCRYRKYGIYRNSPRRSRHDVEGWRRFVCLLNCQIVLTNMTSTSSLIFRGFLFIQISVQLLKWCRLVEHASTPTGILSAYIFMFCSYEMECRFSRTRVEISKITHKT